MDHHILVLWFGGLACVFVTEKVRHAYCLGVGHTIENSPQGLMSTQSVKRKWHIT